MSRAKIMGSQQNSREYLYEALDYVAKGKVKVITETYSLDDIVQAYDRVAAGKVISCCNRTLVISAVIINGILFQPQRNLN
jgi:D-arabinose 1-dehydrogenase-like Zn-dependent alcohol dehydrogenase